MGTTEVNAKLGEDRQIDEPRRLRELAAWLREFAERAGAPWIWEARLIRAKGLEEEADRLELDCRQVVPAQRHSHPEHRIRRL